ncbi:Isochorismatase family protein YecD [Paenibacillus solanacearum]|uniref:Isochorismatase family protein YecD n=1 Tax=Paenibacillus solanacearum TaxID=2048548 RepID=A0A916NQX1_9BACL|nr:hydrolase [Paenibacillus solanacearum]CAG7632404.1 Isochorismatase family protein YecD [Paenibacillus solanacearum]
MPLQIQAAKTALVVIDLQKGITAHKGAPHDSRTVVANASRLADAFRSRGGYVVLVRVAFTDGKDALRPITDQPPASAAARPSDWADIVEEMHLSPSDHIVTKRQWGAFFGTDLDLQLRRRGIETIVLCGISTNIGVEMTAREAFQHHYQQIFAVDAMTAMSAEEHEHTAKYIFPRIGRVRTTDEIVNAMD